MWRPGPYAPGAATPKASPSAKACSATAPQDKKVWRVKVLNGKPDTKVEVGKAFLGPRRLRALEVKKWTDADPKRKSDTSGKNPIFEERISWSGRHVASTNAIPEDVPISRACWRRKGRAKAINIKLPSRGPSPNSKETKKPEASSELQVCNCQLIKTSKTRW